MSEGRGVLIQLFHWYTPGGGMWWKWVADHVESLAETGFTAIWLPPAYKGSSGGHDTGYGVYDLYDLGEFDQKGSVATKYGTKDEYLNAIRAAKESNLHVYADIVLNHRMGADEAERVVATPYRRDDRSTDKGVPVEIEAYTRFLFSGRNSVYSPFTWNHTHFDAVDHNTLDPDGHESIFVFEGKAFDGYVSNEFGNYDYLMGCDLDFDAPEVVDELVEWGTWYLDKTNVDGFRFDAVKHIPEWFFPLWLEKLEWVAGRRLFAVAEYWDPDVDRLMEYVDGTNGILSLFDVPLHFKFHQAGIERRDFNLAKIFEGTLVESDPIHAVTFVANHDSQALQALESVVESWFKPLAYALILLREEGYPCVFIADYEGAVYSDIGHDGNRYDIDMPSFKKLLDVMILIRRRHTFGNRHDYFDHSNTIGWTFTGDDSHPGALAVLMSNGDEGEKRMNVGLAEASFIDVTGHVDVPVMTDSQGFGMFRCESESVSLWLQEVLAHDLPID